MQIVNLTPHLIVVRVGEKNMEFPSAGVARVTALPSTPEVINGIPILPRVRYGEVTGLLAPESGTFYIVSPVTAAAVPERDDLLVPATDPENAIRDGEGRIIAVKALRIA